MIVLPVTGQLNWDVPLNQALHNLASVSFGPNDHGYLAWSDDVCGPTTSANPGVGQVRMVKLPRLPQSVTISNVVAFVGTAGSSLVAGQNFAGLYDAAGTRLGVTADQTAAWGTTGLKSMALTAPVVTTPNAAYWVALVYNGASLSFAASSSVSGFNDLINANLAPATARYTIGPVGQTSLPASITMAARTNSSQSTWAAVS